MNTHPEPHGRMNFCSFPAVFLSDVPWWTLYLAPRPPCFLHFTEGFLQFRALERGIDHARWGGNPSKNKSCKNSSFLGVLCLRSSAISIFPMFFVTFGAPRGKIRSAERSLVDTLSSLSGGPFFAFYRGFLALTDSRWGARGCKREGKWSAPVIPERPRASLSVPERPCARFACVVG